MPPAAHPGQAATPCRLECTLQAGAPRSSHHQAALHGPSSARRACIPMLRSMPGAGHAHLGQGLILLQRGVRPGQQPRDRAQPRVRARQRARRARVALDDGLRALRQVPHLRSGRGLSSVSRFQGIVMKTTHCLRARQWLPHLRSNRALSSSYTFHRCKDHTALACPLVAGRPSEWPQLVQRV